MRFWPTLVLANASRTSCRECIGQPKVLHSRWMQYLTAHTPLHRCSQGGWSLEVKACMGKYVVCVSKLAIGKSARRMCLLWFLAVLIDYRDCKQECCMSVCVCVLMGECMHVCV
jgi:hypothetical protein